MLYQAFNPLEHSFLLYKHWNVCILFTGSIVINFTQFSERYFTSFITKLFRFVMVFHVSLWTEFIWLFIWTKNSESPAPHCGHPGPISGQSTWDLGWTEASEKFFLWLLRFSPRNMIPPMLHTHLHIHIGILPYWQEKWTMSEGLPKGKDSSDNREHLIWKHFHFFTNLKGLKDW